MILSYIRKQVAKSIIKDIDSRNDRFRALMNRKTCKPEYVPIYQHKIITLSDLKTDIQLKYKIQIDDE